MDRYLKLIQSGKLDHVELLRPSASYIKKLADVILERNVINSLSVIFASSGMIEIAHLIIKCHSVSSLTLKSNGNAPHRLKPHTTQFIILASALSLNSSLKLLTIQSIFLGEKEMKALGLAMKENHSLEHLKLCNTNYDGLSDHLNHLFDGLSLNTTLRELTLAKYTFTKETVIDSLVNVLRTNTSISNVALSGCTGKSHSSYFIQKLSEVLGKSSYIHSLALMCMAPLNAHHLKLLLSENLERLYIGNTLIGDEGAEVIANYLNFNPKLKAIDLPSCYITGKGLTLLGKSLVHNTNLKQLGIAYNHLFENGGMQEFITYISENRVVTDIECHPVIGIPIVEEDRFYKLSLKNITDRNCKLCENLFDVLVHAISENCECGEKCKLRHS
jgi:hypothetical protein